MRVLLVFDEPLERVRWDVALRERDHLAVSAPPGADAWRHATAGGLDLVIAQHGPGGADAWRLLAELQEGALPPPRPALIVLLPVEESAQLLPLLQGGADDVIIGPLDPGTIRLRVIAAERRHARRQAAAAPGRAATPPASVGPAPLPFSTDAAGPVRPAAGAVHAAAAEGDAGAPVVSSRPVPAPAPHAANAHDPLPAPYSATGVTPADLAPLADAIAAAGAAAAEAYRALPGDPATARAGLRTVIESLRVLQRLATTALGPLPAPARAPFGGAIPAPGPAVEADPRELVILAEDDEHVRRPLRRTLEQAGLRVLEAADGEVALRLALQHAAQLRLVVTDHRMPRMTGGELVRELKRRAPQLPIVLVSGHGAEDLAAEAGADAYLRKPFQLTDLARTARRLLGPAAA